MVNNFRGSSALPSSLSFSIFCCPHTRKSNKYECLLRSSCHFHRLHLRVQTSLSQTAPFTGLLRAEAVPIAIAPPVIEFFTSSFVEEPARLCGVMLILVAEVALILTHIAVHLICAEEGGERKRRT